MTDIAQDLDVAPVQPDSTPPPVDESELVEEVSIDGMCGVY